MDTELEQPPRAAAADPYAPPPPGTLLRPAPAPMPGSRGHWVWVEGPRQWGGFDIPLVRDPLFWVWVFFMASTTATTVLTQMNTGEVPAILFVSWVCVSAIWWFVPVAARQLWRTRRARRRELVTVERFQVR